MRQTVTVGRIAGIAVGTSWSAIVTLAVILDLLARNALPAAVPGQTAMTYWGFGAGGTVCFAGALIAHELAHALVARRHGVGVRSVTLWLLGGVTRLAGDPATPAADIRIALAGPATSVLAGAVFFGTAAAVSSAGGPRVATATLLWLAVMNGILGFFSLLPGVPLDGGRVLRAILWRYRGDRRQAGRVAAGTGSVIGGVLAVLGVTGILITHAFVAGLWLVALGWFMASAATAGQRAATAGQRTATTGAGLASAPVAGAKTPRPGPGTRWVCLGPLTVAGPPEDPAASGDPLTPLGHGALVRQPPTFGPG